MPTINIEPKAMQNGDNVTAYKDTVGPQQQTYTFLTAQERVILKNSGSKNITYTVGSQSGTLGPSQMVDVKETISSINLTAEQGTQQFEIWADESGTKGTSPEAVQSLGDQVSGFASSLADKATKHWVDVKADFGAIGNGIADDTTAIQNAINSLTSGGTVFLPKGTFNFSELHLADKVSIKGSGRIATILKHTGTGKAIFNNKTPITAISRFTLEDFYLSLNVNTTIGIEFAPVYMAQIIRVEVQGNNASGIGISFDLGGTYSSYYNTCYDVSIGAPLGTGFQFQSNANSCRLINCRTNGVTYPVKIPNYCDQLSFIGCAFEQFTTGITISASTAITLLSNRFENGGSPANGTGISIDATCSQITALGNFYENLATNVSNSSTSQYNLIHNGSNLSFGSLSQLSGGAFVSDLNMGNYHLNNVGSLNLRISSVAQPDSEGVVAYSDGTWQPIGVSYRGLYARDKGGYRIVPLVRQGATASRPADTTVMYVGMQYFDTTLNKPIWLKTVSPVAWVDATGTAV
jgi:hypothetical protein